MSTLVGGVVAFIGGYNALDTITGASKQMRASHNLPRTTTGKITEVAVNALWIIGKFALCLQLVLIGAFVYSSAPALSVWTALGQALNSSLPQFAVALGALGASRIIEVLGRN